MKTQIGINPGDTIKTGNAPRTRGIRQYLEGLRKAVGKYVTIEKDAIYNDPDWPHLWDHKR